MSQISDGILFIIGGYLLFLSVVLFASALRYYVSYFSKRAPLFYGCTGWFGVVSVAKGFDKFRVVIFTGNER